MDSQSKANCKQPLSGGKVELWGKWKNMPFTETLEVGS
jgi:hypothetical protein